jgi:hypothetical protein
MMHQKETDEGGDRVLVFQPGVHECLWKRYGAKGLTSTCSHALNMIQDEDPHTGSMHFINQGRNIARVWGALVVFACLVLLATLGVVGWKLLKRCLTRCCRLELARSTNKQELNKQERKKLLEHHVITFYLASLILGLTNMFLPAVTLCIAGPVAVGTWVWLWCVEFKCATPRAPGDDNEQSIGPANENPYIIITEDF